MGGQLVSYIVTVYLGTYVLSLKFHVMSTLLLAETCAQNLPNRVDLGI